MENKPDLVDQKNSAFSEAITMISYEGQLIWTVFRSILSANGFLVAIFIAMQNFMPGASLGAKWLPVLGVVLCIIWCLITLRMFDYYGYWFAWARHCEKQVFDEDYQIISKGAKFADGNEVTFGEESPRLGWYGRLFKNKQLMLSVIACFLFLYVYFAYFVWCKI